MGEAMGDAWASPLGAPPALALALTGCALAAAALFLRPSLERRVRSLDVPVSPLTSPVLRRLAPQPPYTDSPPTAPDSLGIVTPPGAQGTVGAGALPRVRVGPVHASHRGGAKAWPENTLLAFRNAAGIPLASGKDGNRRLPGKEGAGSGAGAGGTAPSTLQPPANTSVITSVITSDSASESQGPGAGAPAVQLCETRMIELDVQLTRDGQLVVIHNLTVDSTTEGEGPVGGYTLEELQGLDAAYRFSPPDSDSHSGSHNDSHGHSRGTTEGIGGGSAKTNIDDSASKSNEDKGGPQPLYPYRNQGIQIPLLSEALELIASHEDLIVYLDFKTPEAVAPALAMAEQYGLLKDRTVVGAVPLAANRELLRLKPPHVPATPDINTMIVLYVLYLLNLMWLVPLRHEIVGTTVYRWGMKVLDARLIRAFRDRGRLMAVFGDSIDGREGQMECLRAGCDFLVSDRPDVLWETMQAWCAAGCPREA